jgi:hypothetical protein
MEDERRGRQVVPRYGLILLVAGVLAFTLGRGIVAHATEWEEPTGVGLSACAASVLGTVPVCVAANPLCPVIAATIACNCMPLIVDEFAEMTCP